MQVTVSDDTPEHGSGVLLNLADGSLMQQIACLRWYYVVLSKIPFGWCPLHCDMPLIKGLDERVCTFCKPKMSENKYWLCYFGKEKMCEKLEDAPQFKCSCGKNMCEVMPMPCGNADPVHWRGDAKKHYDHFTNLYRNVESYWIAGVLDTPMYYNHPDTLGKQIFEPKQPAETTEK
jgi:hypothetical protein